jgi:hypothetical protein
MQFCVPSGIRSARDVTKTDLVVPKEASAATSRAAGSVSHGNVFRRTASGPSTSAKDAVSAPLRRTRSSEAEVQGQSQDSGQHDALSARARDRAPRLKMKSLGVAILADKTIEAEHGAFARTPSAPVTNDEKVGEVSVRICI